MSNADKRPVYCVYHNDGHPALALGMIVSFAQHCNGGALREAYEFTPGVLRTMEEARAAIAARGPGVLLCSSYIWNARENLEVARAVTEEHPTSFVIFGGPSVPKYDDTCRRFLASHPFVDVTVRGEGEMATAELLACLAAHQHESHGPRDYLAQVPGIAYRPSPRADVTAVARTEDRTRIADVNILPSPYLTGWFDGDDAAQWTAAVIETNRGCPYGCTFCDWGAATMSKVRQFAFDRVQGEIEWIARHGVRVLWIADANFGIFKRDLDIAETIASCRRRFGYPRQVVVNYAKHSSDRLADIVGILQAAGVTADGIISIQTRDPETLQNIQRTNIKTEHYDQLIRVFRRRHLPVSSDLMIGLPGATVESFKADLQFFFDRGVYAKAYQTVVLPNSPMADPEYLKKYKIAIGTRGDIVSTYSFTLADLFTMRQIYFYYRVMVGFAVLKYVLFYLQHDHGLPALTLIDALQSAANARMVSLPKTASLMQALVLDGAVRAVLSRLSAQQWAEWHRELEAFLAERYGIADPALTAVFALQAKLLPATGRVLPETIALPHDAAAYLRDVEEAIDRGDPAASERTRLQEYGPAMLEISDPHGLCTPEALKVYEEHQIEWELSSPLTATGLTCALVTAGRAPAA